MIDIARTLPTIPVGTQNLGVGRNATFGNPLEYASNVSKWESVSLSTRALKTPLRYAYGAGVTMITRIRAHRLIIDEMLGAFEECSAAGISQNRMKYGGSYVWRPIGGSRLLSTHAYGVAFDLEPALNPRDKAWIDDGKMLHPTIIKILKARGWFWGNEFKKRKDPMHFQWCTGY